MLFRTNVLNRWKTKLPFLTLALLVLTGFASPARAGALLDATFGVNGEAPAAGLARYAVQADGKIVSVNKVGSTGSFTLALRRYDVNGNPDQTFGANGLVSTHATTCDDYPNAVAVGADGKIVVLVGGEYCAPGQPSFVVVRYLPDGSLDQSFGAGGVTPIPVPGLPTSYMIALGVDVNGKIVVAGIYDQSRLVVTRYTSGGVVDRSFGRNGLALISRTESPAGLLYANAVSFTRAGEVLLGGRSYGNSPDGYAVAKFGPQGRLQFLRVYGSVSNGQTYPATFSAIYELPDGKILAMGERVARFFSDGQLDPSYPRNQLLTSSEGSSQGFGMRLADGKVVLIRSYTSNGTTRGIIELVGRNGATIGKVSQSEPNVFFGVLAQPDGKLVVIAQNSMRRYLTLSSLAGSQSDFDGNYRTDLGVFRPSTGEWFIRFNDSYTRSLALGQAGDYATPGRYLFYNWAYDEYSNSLSAVSVYRPATHTWYTVGTDNQLTVTDGTEGDTPVAGDFDGDGIGDYTGFQNGVWHIRQSSDSAQITTQWGQAGDVPVPGDYDYDGFADLAVFRPSNGTWYLRRSSDGAMVAQPFGTNGDRPVTGDFDDDGRTDFAVYRPADGTCYLLNSRDGSLRAQQFGIATDRPVPGDYDSDGRTDLAVFREGTWYILLTGNNSVRVVQWGQAGDIPLSPGFTAE